MKALSGWMPSIGTRRRGQQGALADCDTIAGTPATSPKPGGNLGPDCAIPDVIRIERADLDDPQVVDLLEIHARRARAETARGSAHALDLAGLKVPEITVWAAIRDGRAVGVGALKRLSPSEGEVKSMYTTSDGRRAGIGRALLDHIVGTARAEGLARVSLETGSWDYFAPARAFYAKCGFVVCAPFGDYREDPNSVFMTLELVPGPGARLRRRTARAASASRTCPSTSAGSRR
jgi:putative acetyltransferase